jgi:HPt (histidine-containing phosphotransfer) domain-containing protein
MPDLVAAAASGNEPVGALFDPEALRSLFGDDPARLAALVQKFADNAARDIAALRAAPDAKQLVASAHRLRGAARMAGARLMAEQAMSAEVAANAGDLTGARVTADGMERLLAETLRVMRSVG